MEDFAKPSADVLELPLHVRAEMALRAAVREVIASHIRSGRPIHIWRDEKVVEVSAQELRESFGEAGSMDTAEPDS
jgi:hypothetical protein